MKRHLDNELKGLKQSLLKMGNFTSNAVNNALKAALNADLELAAQVIENDAKLNRLEVNIEDFCLKLLALYQPAAIDLRFVTTAMRVNNDLERIGDLAVNVCERVIKLKTAPQGKLRESVVKLANATEGMVADTLECFVNQDTELAEQVSETEDKIDNLNAKIIKDLVKYVIENPKQANKVLGYIFISKNLERLADHLENIAHDVRFTASGKVVRHD